MLTASNKNKYSCTRSLKKTQTTKRDINIRVLGISLCSVLENFQKKKKKMSLREFPPAVWINVIQIWENKNQLLHLKIPKQNTNKKLCRAGGRRLG